jgi:nicotinate-nucleotide pyrophosphorylase (carboxylating)
MTFAQPTGIGLNFPPSHPPPARFMPSVPRLPSVEKLIQRLQWDDLDLAYLRRLVDAARDEDLAGLGLRRRPARAGDLSTLSLPALPRQGAAALVAREPLVVCGLRLAPLVLTAFGGRVAAQFSARDGARVPAGRVLATLHGDPRVLLAAERTLLNFLQRLSGIATTTWRHAAALGSGRTRLLDTRKTTPGQRMLEKYAVACGGGWNHRLGLFDRVMLKDNHLALLGCGPAAPAVPGSAFRVLGSKSTPTQNPKLKTPNLTGRLAAAVAAARRAAPEAPVEVEVDRLDQIPAALSAGADVLLFDNFTVPQLRRAVLLVGGRAFTEASGGLTLKTLPRLAGLGLDFVSTGALVHHSVWVDIGLDWRP